MAAFPLDNPTRTTRTLVGVALILNSLIACAGPGRSALEEEDEDRV